ncbi:multidrug resistance-associated ABC transporter [Exidia glandulosa HHB12029]|uniref:Multidrug resistance-associated ABC transporter n=1 Tax=Exidia glandulosa HHB12029 TaxID=1314781 RepID=A0A165EK30_EXIGL|nr:multidrug resistance-associated ABC transporter [Exidia glandulosa HHB12029]
MPRFQLLLATSLVVAATGSAAVSYFLRPKTGKIALYDDSFEGDEPELAGEKDPFDVTTPEDIIDGTPLNEAQFWQQMKLRKLVVTFLLFLDVAFISTSFGWALASGDVPGADVVALGLRLLFELYLLAMSIVWVTQNTVDNHWPTTVHLSALTGIQLAFLIVTAIVPDSLPPATTVTGSSYGGALQGLWYASLATTFVVFAICSTVPRGPLLHYPSERIYSEKTLATSTTHVPDNVCTLPSGSVWDVLLFSYTTKVVMLGYTAESLEIGDLPIVPSDMRSTTIYAAIRTAMRRIKLPRNWNPAPGSGWALLYRLMHVNAGMLILEFVLAAVCAVLFYSPAFFLQRLVRFLELQEEGVDRSWGWFYCAGLFGSNAFTYILTGQLWSVSTTTLQARMRAQMNTMLFAKTLIRKDVASSSGSSGTSSAGGTRPGTPTPSSPTDTVVEKKDEDEFSSKQQVMTLMTTDVDRVGQLGWYLFPLVDSPIELAIGTLFLYKMLGSSAFIGLAVTCFFLPINHYASKVVVNAQENLMKTRDERVALMNEILGGIRMLKFMAWERSFEKKVMVVRDKELKYQRLNYIIETAFNAIWNGSPLLVTLVSFWHYAVWRGIPLTPSIAFTSISVFNEMRFALNALPETFINILQSLVSARRIEKYLALAEVSPVPPLGEQDLSITLNSATITWPQERGGSASSSVASTPAKKFILLGLNVRFPVGQLSLVCGKLGSGKTLLLQALLGEADVLTGQVLCPRSPPDFIASFQGIVPNDDEWIVPGVCAYVPQVSWLQNATIRENILFHLPYNEVRYLKTLEACALVADMKILEDGDQSEIGERGVNLSGGQKARVSLARAVYSRASTLLLDDVLSAVDAHTADHLFEQCIKGDIMKGRTVILVSHHVQLCTNGAAYVVALDNGRLAYEGPTSDFVGSQIMAGLVQSSNAPAPDQEAAEDDVEALAEQQAEGDAESAEGSDTAVQPSEPDALPVAAVPKERKAPRKFIEEEKRAVGRIGSAVWQWYIYACGGKGYWALFLASMIAAALVPVFENGWIRVWSGSVQHGTSRSPAWYVGVYASITVSGLLLTTWRWFVLYHGSLEASRVLYKRLLERVLFARIRFHDTINRGRLLNRFGKDFEGIDSNLSDNFGRSIINALSVTTTVCSVTYVGGLPFGVAAAAVGVIYWNVAKIYGQTSRDMRRLDSVTRSPLYSIYGETISGVGVIRAFGAGSKFLRDMLRCVDTNMNPYFWMWSVNRWLSVRFNLLSSIVVGVTGVTVMLTPGVDAALAGFALAFASTITGDLLFLVRRFVGLEQSMVAVERVKEFSEIEQEPPEFIEPRPPASWPSEGAIAVEDLSIRYANDLPNVLHELNFDIYPGEKVGVLGRTGSGKSTLALSFFRFVEPSQGRIVIDGVDIARVGLTDLRCRLTIIPQDPTILSGTLRSTLDVFDEYEDAEIYEALRRVHLLQSGEMEETAAIINENVFRNLDSPVSEGGENFSAGEKQLICMARAILKRTKVLFMDEATASVDYATDELISKTIREEFADSTIVTIAHRLRTVVDYNRVMLLDNGQVRVAEFDRPAALLSDPTSKFYALCKAAGKDEFQVLKRMAGAL